MAVIPRANHSIAPRAKKSIGNKFLKQKQKGKKITKNVWAPIKKAGRPKKADVNAKRFASWTTHAGNVVSIVNGKVVIKHPPSKAVYKTAPSMKKNQKPMMVKPNLLLLRPQPKLIPEVDDTVPITPQNQLENRQRMRFIESRAVESHRAIAEGDLMPSSVVLSLEWIEHSLGSPIGNVIVNIDGRMYTYFYVPSHIFDRWWAGKATCQTDDTGGFSGRKMKRWIKGKTPSLGAFYNQYIKGQYTVARGIHHQAPSYADLLEEPADPRYMKKVGAPRKIVRNTRDFKWTPQFKKKYGGS